MKPTTTLAVIRLAALFATSLTIAACGSSVSVANDGPQGREDATVTRAGAFGPWQFYLDVGSNDPLTWQANTSNTPAEPTFEMANDEITFSLPGFFLGTKKVGTKTYTRVLLPNTPPLSQAGYPELPVVRASFPVPATFTGSVTIVDSNYYDVPLAHAVLPSRGGLDRNIDPSGVAYSEGPFYASQDEYPALELASYAPFTLRAMTGLPVVVQPFRVIPSLGVLRVYTDIRARIVTDGTLGEERSSVAESPDFAALYGQIFKSSGAATRYTAINEPGRMIVIAADAFKTAAQPLVDWKNQRGLLTELVPLSQVGTTSTAIKSYIKTQYQSAAKLTYVILVGDSDTVPTLRGTYESAASDTTYGMVAGSDLYPDVFVSRISARTAAQVSTQVNKLIAYERDPNPTATWYKSAIGIGSDQGSPTDSDRVEGLRTALEGFGFTSVAKIYDPNASLSTLTSKINAGASIMNYIGHGAGTYWVTTGFSVDDAAGLTNTGKYPFVVDVSCVNGAFADYDACLAESFMRAGTPSAPAGAIAMFSASTNASWVPPTVMQDYVIKNLVVGGTAYTAGGLYYGGAMKALDQYGSGEGTKLIEQYNIFGDASLMVRTKQPKALTVTNPTSIQAAGSLSVNATLAGGGTLAFATAALSQANKLIVAKTNATGTFALSYSGLATGTAVLTVTAFNAVPAIIQLTVVGGTGNQAPVADAGSAQSVQSGATVHLDGSASADPDGEALAYAWTQTAGTSVTLTGATTAQPQFVAPTVTQNATFTFSLVVTDANAASNAASVTVTVTPASTPTTDAKVVVNEVMANPACVADSAGEWVELRNVGTQAVTLTGWILSDKGSDRYVLPTLSIPAQGFVVLCRNSTATANGNVTCNATYTSTVLSNTADTVILSKPDGTVVDQMQYGTGSGVSIPNGASMARHDGTTTTWSASTAAITGGCGDKATPGKANP